MTNVSTSKPIYALGSVTATATAAATIRFETKEALTKHRQSTPPNSLDSLTLLMKADEVTALYDPMELAGLVTLLKKKSALEIRVEGSDVVAATRMIHTSLLLAGFKAASERREGDWRILQAVRKETTSTTSQPIRRLVTNNKTTAVIDDDDEDDLIDEDDLLTVLAAPNMTPRTIAVGDDCSGRKPCDDCSCGRADGQQQQQSLSKKALVQKTSACGSCAKGDAFRCASCPFLGKPAFKAGQEHLVLDLMDDF